MLRSQYSSDELPVFFFGKNYVNFFQEEIVNFFWGKILIYFCRPSLSFFRDDRPIRNSEKSVP